MDINGISINWIFEPTILLGLALWAAVYTVAVNQMRRRFHWGEPVPVVRQIAFHLGTISAVIALLSPLDTLSDTYLFSAHMTQHMLLMFVAAPLWLLGIPGWLVCQWIPFPSIRNALYKLTRPAVAFLIFNGVMWLWHIPTVYDAALRNEPLHIAEHLLFIGAAFIGWWPVLGPSFDAKSTISPPLKVGYLVASMFACTALAALITLAQRQLFTFYGDASLTMGLQPLVDQQIGGAVMWVPGDMIYMLLIGWVFYQWMQSFDQPIKQVSLKV
ncbi:MAG: cytochrome c oxidase assembly protein [Chloroflexota bacterium]